MKTTLAFFVLLFSFGLFAQAQREVTSDLIDLGNLRGTNKIVLKLTPQSPEELKIVFNYQYQFVSQEIDQVFVGAGGNLGFSTRNSYSEIYNSKQKIALDISRSTVVSKSEELSVVLDISKPNKDSHWVKVEVSLKDAKGNTVSGGRKLLGLLGRSYKIEEAQCK